jgi:hypothetical protein
MKMSWLQWVRKMRRLRGRKSVRKYATYLIRRTCLYTPRIPFVITAYDPGLIIPQQL